MASHGGQGGPEVGATKGPHHRYRHDPAGRITVTSGSSEANLVQPGSSSRGTVQSSEEPWYLLQSYLRISPVSNLPVPLGEKWGPVEHVRGSQKE